MSWMLSAVAFARSAFAAAVALRTQLRGASPKDPANPTGGRASLSFTPMRANAKCRRSAVCSRWPTTPVTNWTISKAGGPNGQRTCIPWS